ncbi:TldD/PmbA family protein [Sphingomicrobium astaxanthinifaciens]|uniref:TldD/PmbA family protein n=1 Tax=Sphingomicrobium astaxanthinifaciens TaxID=1227949 RepID=UPI001FCBBACA|nr:metallopeptidase TldD-related protein [Sphingomicrobium astaxanthinifaciens]MCJ7421577.1 metallopeptidase TldD-related protein [Sphingomicrobium astaxanthinifaciens]
MRNLEHARQATRRAVDLAIKAGASAADAALVASGSSSVEVRMGALEDVQRSEGEKLGLRVFLGQRVASVSSSDLSEDGLAGLASRAVAMAKAASEDEYAGLAPEAMLMDGAAPDLDLYEDNEPGPEALKERALECEAAALAIDKVANSSGASASASSSLFALATSHGVDAAFRSSGHGCSVAVIAEDASGSERDYAYHSARYLADLEDARAIGTRAGERAAARLSPRRFEGGRMPVLFDPRVATSLLSHLAAALSGNAVARRSSFLQDKMGEQVFAPGVTITDDPLRKRGLRSHGFDGEGLPVQRMHIVEDGRLQSWFAASAAARQLGIDPTGHAIRGPGGAPGAGPSNFWIEAGERSRAELLGAHPRCFLVTELIGQGVNGVTGDYSRGAAGFYVEHGEIVAPASGATIAANLKDMFATLEPGSDLELRKGVDAPTLLVPEMTVAVG